MAFIAEEFAAAEAWAQGDGAPVSDEARADAVALYRQVVERLG